ncbi:MAG: FG-GAP repeat protein [Bacteroidota bacterium]
MKTVKIRRQTPQNNSYFLFSLLFLLSPLLLLGQESHNWNKLILEQGHHADNFGKSVAVSGDYAIVGAWTEDEKGPEAGAAYIFQKDAATESWQLSQKLTASDGAAFHNFGATVLIQGEWAVVGAHGHSQFAGAVYLFRQENDRWIEFKKLTARDRAKSDFFGSSLAMSGGRVIVGAYGDDNGGKNTGAVYIFEQNEGGKDHWGERAKLTSGDNGHRDHFGISIATDGEIIVVGADGNNRRGSFYVFNEVAGNWRADLQVFASDGAIKDRFAHSLAISGDYIVAGADRCDAKTGAVYIFERHLGGANNWGEVLKIRPVDGMAGDCFGKQIGLDGPFLIVGSEGNQQKQGAAYIYRLDKDRDQWKMFDKLMAEDGLPNDLFGASLAVQEKNVWVGAFQANATGGMYTINLQDKPELAAKGEKGLRRE